MLTFVVIDSGRLVDCMCLDMQKLNILDEYLHNLHLLLLKVLKLFPLNGIKQTVQLWACDIAGRVTARYKLVCHLY